MANMPKFNPQKKLFLLLEHSPLNYSGHRKRARSNLRWQKERICMIITELIAYLSVISDIDVESLMKKLFSESEKTAKHMNFESLSQVG